MFVNVGIERFGSLPAMTSRDSCRRMVVDEVAGDMKICGVVSCKRVHHENALD